MAQKKLSEGRRQAVQEELDEMKELFVELDGIVAKYENMAMYHLLLLVGSENTRDSLEEMLDELVASDHDCVMNIQATMVHTDHKMELEEGDLQSILTRLQEARTEFQDSIQDCKQKIERIKMMLE